MTLSPKIGVVGINTPWHFRFQMPINLKNKHSKDTIFSHININSFRYKYIALQEILYEKYVDILIVGETKLDSSFPDAQFKAEGYTMFRKDRNSNTGGNQGN